MNENASNSPRKTRIEEIYEDLDNLGDATNGMTLSWIGAQVSSSISIVERWVAARGHEIEPPLGPKDRWRGRRIKKKASE